MKNNTGEKNRIFSLIIMCIAFSLFFILFSLFFILITQILPSHGTTAIALASSGPSIYFPEDSWDFGEITPDELPTHIFKFKNIGDEVLIIKGTKVSYESCIDPLISTKELNPGEEGIDPLISTKELNPGEEGELKITVNSLDMIGRFTKRIYVESNDPVNPRAAVTVSGFIKEKNESVVQSQPKPQVQPQPQPKTPFRIGMSYFGKGEYDKAIIEFEESIELDENHTESYYYLGQCYLQKGIIEYNNKNIFKAYSLYRKANKFAEQVIPQYEKIIEDNPRDLNSYLRLGYIYEVRSIVPFINDYDKALEYYLKALDLATGSSPAGNTGIIIYLNVRIGIVYFEKKKYSQAIEYLEMAEKMSPQNVEVAYYLGLSYDKIGEIEKAREFLSRVIEFAPQSEFAQEAEKKLKKINKD
jgi:tetratricopeptide (TPR) repeat protein